MDAYALHLATAAFIGASFVAVSAYYMHRKTLNQIMDFAKAIDQRERDNGAVENENEINHSVEQLNKYPSRTCRKGSDGYYRRSSVSLPDVTAFYGGDGGHMEDKRNGALQVDAVLRSLSRLHVVPEGDN